MNCNGEDIAALHSIARHLGAQELPHGWEIVPSSHFARVARNQQQQLYYKEFLARSPWDRFKALLRGSRARRARLHGDALLRAGIDAPENIAWGKLPGGSEYLFTRAVGGETVTAWLAQDRELSRVMRRQLLAELGQFIGRVHATGFVHGDLRPGNVLARHNGDRFLFTLLDNERTVQRLPPPGRMLLRNLMQLNMLPLQVLGRTDRMRFFRAWRRQMRDLEPIEAKLLAAEAYQWALQRMYEKGTL
jgi:serine/threonine protein kinase